MRPSALLVTLALWGAPPSAFGQAAADQGGFIVRLGLDTVTVERFWRIGPRLVGRCLTRTPVSTLREYQVTFDSTGQATSYELRRTRPWLAHDSAAVWSRGFQGPLAPAIPFIGSCWALLEVATRRFVPTGRPIGSQLTLTAGDPDEVDTIPLALVGRDSATIEVIGGLPYRAAVDAEGRVLGVRWIGDWTVERLPGLDLDAFIAAFARRPLGPLSPPDSVAAMLGGSSVSVRYARPARRGRAIFGHIVPWNAVWRTGANEATILETAADLRIAGKTIPAGKYSVWTIPAPNGWTLILNRNTGQWGTDYEAKYDFVRLPMQVETLPDLVERFTIAIEPRGTRGVLQLEWETTRAWVELARK